MDADSQYLADCLDEPLVSITPDMVEKRHESICAEVASRNKRADGSAKCALVQGYHAANSALRILRTVWNLVEGTTPLPPNPISRLKRAWYPERRRDRIVRASQLPAFYRAICALENATQRDYLLLLLFTGLRRTEAASLTWADIDFDEGIIRLRATKTKSGRRLDLPMPDYVRELLTARRAIGVEEGDWVFAATSKSGHIAEPRAALDVIADKTGIRVSPHDLRRGFITAAESLDLSAYALKGLVNHSLGGSDVTGGYVIASAERLRAPMQRVTDRLKVLCQIDRPMQRAAAA